MAARQPPSKNDPAHGTPAADGKASGDEAARASRKRKESFKSLLGAVLLFLFLRTFIVEAFRIPSGSMIPALLVNDWLFVNKLAYGPNIPFTDINLPGYTQPKRFDIVVFKSPLQIDEPANPHPTLVKRLVGLPGDTLYMRSDLLYINGEPRPQTGEELRNPVEDPNYYDPLFEWQKKFEIHGSRFGEPPARMSLGNWGPIVIPPNHYLMLGDNRHKSKDGRFWGLVPRQNIRGKPLIVYYSFVPQDESDRALPALTDIRWWRIGHRIK